MFCAFSLQLFAGKVVRVIDGDTVEFLDQHRTVHRIRLAGIDASEIGQDYGNRAKRHLTRLSAGKTVAVQFNKRDRYRRIVGKIVADDRDADLDMVRSGHAWWYQKYAGEQTPRDQALYEAAEDKARSDHAGL